MADRVSGGAEERESRMAFAATLGMKFRATFGGPDISELLRGASTTLILRVLGVACSYAFSLAVARMYGASVLGLFSLAVTVGSVFSLLGLFGTNTAIIRFVAAGGIRENRADILRLQRRTAVLVAAVSAVAGGILFFMSPYLAAGVFGKPRLRIAFQVTACAVPFASVMALNAGSLQGLKRIRDALIFRTVFPPAVSGVCLALLTCAVARDYMVPVYANALSLGAGAVVSWVMWQRGAARAASRPASQETLRPAAGASRVGDLVRAAIPMFLTSGMFFVMDWTDILMLGAYVGERDIGVYRVASKLALLTSFNLVAVNSIATPKFAELFWAGEKDRLRSLAQFSAKMLFFSSVPVCAGLIVFAGPAMGVFGSEFVRGVQLLIILAAGQLVNAMAGSTGPLLNMTGHQKVFRNIICSAALLNIVLNFILIRRYGVLGAASATAASVILLNIASSVVIRRIFGFWLVFIPFLSSRRAGR